MQRQRGHSQGRFGLFGYAGRAAEDVGAELVPVRAAGRAAGEGEGAVERGAQVVEVVQAQALREPDALEEPGPAVGVVGRGAEEEGVASGARNGNRSPRETSGYATAPDGSKAAARSSMATGSTSAYNAPAPTLDAPPGSQVPPGARWL